MVLNKIPCFFPSFSHLYPKLHFSPQHPPSFRSRAAGVLGGDGSTLVNCSACEGKMFHLNVKGEAKSPNSVYICNKQHHVHTHMPCLLCK